MVKRGIGAAVHYMRLARDIRLLPEDFRAMLARRGMSYREAAREMGVVTSTAWKVGNTQNRLQVDTILIVIEWLELSSALVAVENSDLKENSKKASR